MLLRSGPSCFGDTGLLAAGRSGYETASPITTAEKRQKVEKPGCTVGNCALNDVLIAQAVNAEEKGCLALGEYRGCKLRRPLTDQAEGQAIFPTFLGDARKDVLSPSYAPAL